MNLYRFTARPFSVRACLSVMTVAVAFLLVGCDSSSEAKSSSTASTEKAKDIEQGIVLQGDELRLDATTSVAILPGYSQQPLSLRIMGGWVNTDKTQKANAETDLAENKKQLMGSFGTLTIQITAGKAEPGSYQLGPEGSDPQSGTIIIDKVAEIGLNDDYTSQSGTLTIKSISMGETRPTAIEASFEGQFSSRAGDSRALSGQLKFASKQK